MQEELTIAEQHKALTNAFRTVNIGTADSGKFEGWIPGLTVSGSKKIPFTVEAESADGTIAAIFDALTVANREISYAVPYSTGPNLYVWNNDAKKFALK